MSTISHIYYEVSVQVYTDMSNRSLNFVCDLEVLVDVDYDAGRFVVEWRADAMPNKISIPFSDIRKFNIDRDGLMIEMSENTPTAQAVLQEGGIECLAS